MVDATLGADVRHLPDGRVGKVVARMVVEHLDDPDVTNVLVEYVDQQGSTSQAWFAEGDVEPFVAPEAA